MSATASAVGIGVNDSTPASVGAVDPSAESNVLKAALSYAARGWPVFPLSGKKPLAGSRGFKDATTSTEQIRAWWKAHPGSNVGIATGKESGLLVIDCDPRNGGDLNGLGLPDSVTSMTGGGGEHRLFRYVEGIKGGSNALGPGLDVKADGGYIVAPPSVHPETKRSYEWDFVATPDSMELAELPAQIIAKLASTRSERVTLAAGELVPVGQRERVALSVLGASVRLFGLSEEGRRDFIRAMNKQFAEPLAESDIARMARSSMKWETEGMLPDLNRKAAASEPPRFWSLGGLWREEFPPVEGFLADQLFVRQTVNLIAGRRSAGKTYLVLGLLQSIARGESFGHLKTRQGRVVFLSQEMTAGQINNRVRKLMSASQAEEFAESVAVGCKLPVRVDTDAGARELRAIIEKAGQFDVVIIDALRDIKGAAAEDSNDDMGQVFGRLRDLVAVPLNCCLIVIHHKGKPSDMGTDRGGRGASAIEDVCADVIYLDVRKGGVRVGSVAKGRDDVAGPFTFDIEDDVWEDGRKRVVVTIRPGGDPEEDDELREARKVADYVGNKEAVTRQEVEKHFRIGKATAQRRLDTARAADWIKEGGKGGPNGQATLWVPAH